MLGLHCGARASHCRGLSCCGARAPGARASVVVAHRLSSCGHRPSCSAACGIFPDQGSNPCPLHWQADSQPLSHEGSPRNPFLFKYLHQYLLSKVFKFWDFPVGAVVKNPPANAGDTGSSPGPGRSHMPQSKYAHAPQLLSLRSRACEPQLLSPCAATTEARAPRARALQQEKPLQCEARAPQ